MNRIRPARVVWISCVGEKGGSEVTMLNTFRELDRERFRPGLVMLRPGPLEAEARAAGADVWVFEKHRMREVVEVVEAIYAIKQLIVREGIDLIHSNGFRAHVYGGVAAAWAGTPEVWTNHAVETPGWSTRLICSIPTTQIIANCTRTERFFADRGLPTQTVWPGVSLARLARGTPRGALATRFGVPEHRRWVSMGARLQRFKGQHYFLKAIAALPESANVHAWVMGAALFGLEEEYATELKETARALGLEGRITFTGFISDEDVAGILGASELVVHPALDEDFGLTVAESQALGVPVLSFATAGPSVIVEEGRTGWLTPIGDQARLTAKLEEVLADREQLHRCGVAGRERVIERFTIEQHVRETELVYTRCLNGG